MDPVDSFINHSDKSLKNNFMDHQTRTIIKSDCSLLQIMLLFSVIKKELSKHAHTNHDGG